MPRRRVRPPDGATGKGDTSVEAGATRRAGQAGSMADMAVNDLMWRKDDGLAVDPRTRWSPARSWPAQRRSVDTDQR